MPKVLHTLFLFQRRYLNLYGFIIPQRDTITYTAFDRVSNISGTVGTDNYALGFTYGPDRQRWKTELKKNGVSQKTIIFAGNYESITENGVTKHLYYISGGDGLAAVYVKQSGQLDKTYYVHADHLGSIVKLTDGNGTEVFKASYDAWGKRTVTNNTFKFHRGFTGHEHLPEFNLVNANARLYDPVLGRFLSPDPFVQFPDFSQSYNRYSYALNNPLKYTDPDGEWNWLVAGIGLVYGYVSHGIINDDWGWKAVVNGAITGVSWGVGYTSQVSAAGTSPLSYAAYSAATSTVNSFMPSVNVPIGNHFGVSVSPGLGFGTSGLTGGLNAGVSYTNGDLAVGAGVGVATNSWGWNAAVTYDGWGGGYGQTYYSPSTVMGWNFGAQTTATFTGYFNHNSFAISNDLWGDEWDRWRTSAFELTIGKYSIGSYIYTNWGLEASGERRDENAVAPLWGHSEEGSWKNGRVYFAPAWIGYKQGNQVTRIGLNHKVVQNLTQNFVHQLPFIKTPYFLNYDDFIPSRGYSYYGYNNPFSLWER